jgi:AcrR family transcriptional regulator
VRRTQAERSAATRRKLERAAIVSLAQRGYAGASTTEIARRAGLSQGALFRHYASKADLLAAAADRVYAEMRAAYRRAFSAQQAEGGTRSAIRILWDLFRRPEMRASYELAIAARTDPSLRRALEPVFVRHTAQNQAAAAELSPGTRFASPAVLTTVIWAIQGAAMDSSVTLDRDEEEQFLETLTGFAQREPDARS